MIKILITLFSFQLLLFAYSDVDLDGVEDSYDRCPNTPFYELVDTFGCTKNSSKSEHSFDFIYGISYTSIENSLIDKTNTTSQNIQFDYYYKDFSLELSTSYFNTQSNSYNESGSSDSFIGGYYQIIPSEKVKIKAGIGAILPSYDTELNNNNTDYSATFSVSYALALVNIFAGYNYTIINDDNVDAEILTIYQNTNSYSMGIGFNPSDKTYLSASYFSSDSVYVGFDNIETISIYGFYEISSDWFATLSYAHGISDGASDLYSSLRVGYNF